ncbi:Na(+)-translocating NADH-quinone reductase subunit A [Imperialibacter roseus]|uniref:Na(+)-translocating NADH-quinone reductase subunit A n=1 Tax=Imperialibacter roseus TaxID=1324217 RepID=A0ABZ0IU47_9BACT|nr:Na(+)-translocating NADH-quinone reductase subunit A [Imperialibacter roseus]WOK07664.1 Na(+)-translocating NADH-quinone reductase subunit A [Imperialibacter roseus]
MSKFVKLKKGFNINLAGKAEEKIGEIQQPETFAVKPTDFQRITRPKLLVEEGASVKAGTPLFFDRLQENVMYTSPVSGEVVEIKRGEKRKLLEIKILADKKITHEQFTKFTVSEMSSLTKETATELLTKSGVWPNIVQRPFGSIADPTATPKAIFISAFDTNPLSPNYGILFKGQDQYFQAGIDVLKKFTPGVVHVNTNADAEVLPMFAHVKGAEVNKFSGPNPAGNVGVQIHHLDPINKGDLVWTVSPFGVIQIGKLFLEGIYDASKVIAVCGSEVSNPQYYSTYSGANVGRFIEGNLKSDHVRVISGNVLSGEAVGKDGFLGFFANQVTVIPEGDKEEFLGWILPTFNKLSFQRAFGLFANTKREFVLDTNTHGEQRSFVQSGNLEKVLPMDIYVTYLMKAILAEDYDDMEALGIYEVIEEDLALCEFVDVSKNDIQKILRQGLDLIQYS